MQVDGQARPTEGAVGVRGAWHGWALLPGPSVPTRVESSTAAMTARAKVARAAVEIIGPRLGGDDGWEAIACGLRRRPEPFGAFDMAGNVAGVGRCAVLSLRTAAWWDDRARHARRLVDDGYAELAPPPRARQGEP